MARSRQPPSPTGSRHRFSGAVNRAGDILGKRFKAGTQFIFGTTYHRQPAIVGGSETGEVDHVEVGVGVLLGHVGENEVRTPFAGQVVGFLAHAGERVVTGQPLAWLRVSAAGT